MRTPKDLNDVECYPWEPDDKGGGFACLSIYTTVYDEKQLNRLIKTLEKRRKWLAWQSVGRFEPKPKRKARK